jgi:hypothetical protein
MWLAAPGFRQAGEMGQIAIRRGSEKWPQQQRDIVGGGSSVLVGVLAKYVAVAVRVLPQADICRGTLSKDLSHRAALFPAQMKHTTSCAFAARPVANAAAPSSIKTACCPQA